MIDEITWENQESFLRLKKENPFSSHLSKQVSKRRKRKYMEYLECEFGYKIDKRNGEIK